MEQRVITYDDTTVRRFIAAGVIFGAVAMLVGAIIATQMIWWQANLGVPYLVFSRLRPLHTNAAIFAFVGNSMFAGIYYSTQRLCKARMASDLLSKIHFWGWQLIIVAAAITLPLGITTSQGVRRAGVADRRGDHRDLGGLRDQLLLDPGQAPREEPLRRALVLHRDHRHHRRAAHRQQPGRSRSP